METTIEYRVRPVTRYIVTKFEQLTNEEGDTVAASSTQCGEYDSYQQAYDVGYALARADHNRLGYPPGDERIIYPEHPSPAQPHSLGGEVAGS